MLLEHLDLRGSSERDTFKAQYESPIGAKTSVRVQLPLVRVTGNPMVKNDFGLGDIAVRLNYLHDVNRERGLTVLTSTDRTVRGTS